MEKRTKKVYDKAMDYYERGKINKALELCESELSESLKNPAILNLKGLLLYQKGDLNGAVTVWKINKDFNNDAISKNYIKGAEDDKKRLELYNLGESELKRLKIDSAIQIFEKCAESDFNSIKVNIALALCYQRKGNFQKAQDYVKKVLKIDENSAVAKEIKKELQEIGMYDKEKTSNKKVIFFTIGALFIVLIGLSNYKTIGLWKGIINNKTTEQVEPNKDLVKNENLEKSENSEKNNNVEEQQNTQESDSEQEKQQQENKVADNTSKDEKNKQIVDLDNEKLTALINNNDVYEVYNQIKGIKEDQLKDEDQNTYKQAINLLQNTGVEQFYQDGLWYFNEGNYETAEVELSKAYEYCDGNYLKEHVIYYRATSFLKKGNTNDASKGYEEYYNLYSNGSYIEDTLYQLALLNNDIDKEKSKKYANVLMNNYPKSIFINEHILKIVNE